MPVYIPVWVSVYPVWFPVYRFPSGLPFPGYRYRPCPALSICPVACPSYSRSPSLPADSRPSAFAFARCLVAVCLSSVPEFQAIDFKGNFPLADRAVLGLLNASNSHLPRVYTRGRVRVHPRVREGVRGGSAGVGMGRTTLADAIQNLVRGLLEALRPVLETSLVGVAQVQGQDVLPQELGQVPVGATGAPVGTPCGWPGGPRAGFQEVGRG